MTLDNQQKERVRGAFAALTDSAPIGVEFDELTQLVVSNTAIRAHGEPWEAARHPLGKRLVVAGVVAAFVLLFSLTALLSTPTRSIESQ